MAKLLHGSTAWLICPVELITISHLPQKTRSIAHLHTKFQIHGQTIWVIWWLECRTIASLSTRVQIHGSFTHLNSDLWLICHPQDSRSMTHLSTIIVPNVCFSNSTGFICNCVMKRSLPLMSQESNSCMVEPRSMSHLLTRVQIHGSSAH